jgi:flavin reductase (DIM6/NTAB) family NADH-FMN oxidoreductase RutF
MLEASGEFGLSFCSDEQALQSHVAGSYSIRDTDKWSLADFPIYPAQKIKAPMIDGALINVECRIVAKHELGHTVFIAEAIWARYDPEKRPLLYHDGKYWHLGDQVAKE